MEWAFGPLGFVGKVGGSWVRVSHFKSRGIDDWMLDNCGCQCCAKRCLVELG